MIVIDQSEEKKQKLSHILMLTTSPMQYMRLDTITDLFTFLLRYPSLLNDATNPQNSRVQKTPQLNAPQGNIYMGTRYLDPKYSRWISVDPALGEYVPQAPVNDDAKKHNQNLPGMGGVFNSVNLSLFHYAGNNPVRYVDPDGKIITIRIYHSDARLFRYVSYYKWDNEANCFRDFFGKIVSDGGFVDHVAECIKYLKNSSTAECLIYCLSNSKNDVCIQPSKYETQIYTHGKDAVIYFDIDSILELNDGTGSKNSTAIGLGHEFVHSFDHVILGVYRKYHNDTSVDPKYLNRAEKRAVLMTNCFAEELGEAVRHDYTSARSKKRKEGQDLTFFINNQ